MLPYDKNKDTYYVPGAHSGNHSPVPQIEAVVDSGVSATTVGGPSKPAAFNDAFYSGEVSSSATEVVGDKWHSLFLPPSWYAVLPTGVALWGAIPDRLQISPLDPTEGTLRLESCTSTLRRPA